MKAGILYLLLAAAVVTAYWGSFPGAFHFDDFPLLLENPHVTSPSFRWFDFAEMYGGRPLTIWTFHLNYLLTGESPAGFHLVSVLLHGVSVLLLYRLLFLLGAGRMVAWSAALLFAVHPALVQAVNYVWARSILLMAVFGFLSLILSKRSQVASLVCWQLAVLSRVEGILFLVPLVLLNWRALRPGLAIALVNAAAFFYGFARYQPAEFAFNHSSWLDYWVQAPASFWHYLQLLAFPGGFAIYHGFSASGALTLVAAASAALVLGIALFRFRRQEPGLALSAAWMILFLLPSLLVPNTEGVSESRLYVAGAGFCVALAMLLVRLGRTLEKVMPARRAVWAVLPPILAVAVGGAGLTMGRHPVWGDDVAIWREAVARHPEQGLAQYNLAAALSRVGANGEAREAFERSRSLNPEDDMSYAGLGFCAESDGRLDEAQRFYETALTFNPDNSYAREGLTRLRGPSGGVPRN